MLRQGRYGQGRRGGPPHRQGEQPQAVPRPQPFRLKIQDAAVVRLQLPAAFLFRRRAADDRFDPVYLSGEAVGETQAAGDPGHRQPEPVGQAQEPGGVLPPLDPCGGPSQLRPAPQHGGQADGQSQKGQGRHSEKNEMEQVAHVQDLPQERQQQGEGIEHPPSQHGATVPWAGPRSAGRRGQSSGNRWCAPRREPSAAGGRRRPPRWSARPPAPHSPAPAERPPRG